MVHKREMFILRQTQIGTTRGISTKPGMNQVTFPIDDIWTRSIGVAFVYASKETGQFIISLRADADTQISRGAAGVMLWVFPEDASKVLVLLPTIRGGYSWQTRTAAGPTAHSNGYLNVLIRVYDGQGAIIDELKQDHRKHIWSGGSSGFDDKQNGHDTILHMPYFVLRGGTSYEVWFWIEAINDAGSNFWGGWSSSLCHFYATLESVKIAQI